MAVIGDWEYPDFERWVEKNFPLLFEEWECDFSEVMDLGDWIYATYPEVLSEWWDEDIVVLDGGT
jgi:hypothetical protein